MANLKAYQDRKVGEHFVPPSKKKMVWRSHGDHMWGIEQRLRHRASPARPPSPTRFARSRGVAWVEYSVLKSEQSVKEKTQRFATHRSQWTALPPHKRPLFEAQYRPPKGGGLFSGPKDFAESKKRCHSEPTEVAHYSDPDPLKRGGLLLRD